MDDSCIILSLSRNEFEKYIQGTHTLNQRQIIFDLGGNLNNNKNLGYFEFDGYLVFVYGDSFMKKFFVYTTSKRKFILIKPKVKDTLSFIRGFMSWAVFYRDGKFNYGVY